MNPFKSLLRLIKDVSVSKLELTAIPPFVKLVFDRDELLGLMQSHSLVADTISQQFIRRRVFWEDFAREDPDYALRSLEQAETGLDAFSAKLAASKDKSAIALTKFVRSWASACALTRKSLKQRLDEIDEEKSANFGSYDWAGEDRKEALCDALVSLRRTVYPLLIALVGFLPDNDPTKQETQEFLDRGLNFIPDAELQRNVIPDWDEASARAV